MQQRPLVYLEYSRYDPQETFNLQGDELNVNFNPFEGIDIFRYRHTYNGKTPQNGGASKQNVIHHKQSKKIKDTDEVKQKKSKIPGIDFPLQDGRTALHIAAEKGQIQATRSLLKAGANTNVYDKKGSSPLHEASQRGHKQIVRLLLEKNAFINIPNHSGSLPIHLAAINGHEDTVQILTGNDPSKGQIDLIDDVLEQQDTKTTSMEGGDIAHDRKQSNQLLNDQSFENLKEGEERELYLPSQPNLNNFLFPNIESQQPQANNKEGLFAKLGKKMLSKTMSFLQPKTPFM